MLLFVLAFVAAVIVPTWLFGGFEQQPKEPLPKVEAGKTVAYGELSIKVIGAKLVDKHPTSSFDDKKGMTYLVLQATLENRSKDTVFTFDELFLLGKPVFPKKREPDDAGMVRDNSSAGSLIPGVPETMQLIWAIPDEQAAKVGNNLTITLQRRVWMESFFEERYKWMSPRPWLTVDVPVVRET